MADKKVAYNQRWRAENKERFLKRSRDYNKKWRAANRDKHLAKRREWCRNNRDKERNYRLKRTYGITLEEYNAMFLSQGSACAICGSTEPYGKGWHVDHCHKTNKVRGVLCHYCNVSVGNAKDDPNILRKAAEYLERTSQ